MCAKNRKWLGFMNKMLSNKYALFYETLAENVSYAGFVKAFGTVLLTDNSVCRCMENWLKDCIHSALSIVVGIGTPRLGSPFMTTQVVQGKVAHHKINKHIFYPVRN